MVSALRKRVDGKKSCRKWERREGVLRKRETGRLRSASEWRRNSSRFLFFISASGCKGRYRKVALILLCWIRPIAGTTAADGNAYVPLIPTFPATLRYPPYHTHSLLRRNSVRLFPVVDYPGGRKWYNELKISVHFFLSHTLSSSR